MREDIAQLFNFHTNFVNNSTPRSHGPHSAGGDMTLSCRISLCGLRKFASHDILILKGDTCTPDETLRLNRSFGREKKKG